MTPDQTTTLWLGAFRYYCGRQTYAVGNFCDLLREAWPTLPESTRFLIRRDLETEFAHDDRAREGAEAYKPLGDDCDRQEWEKVRAIWKSSATEAAQ